MNPLTPGQGELGVIAVYIRQVYGRHLVYPANPAADLVATLVGSKTLTPAQLAILKDLGFRIERAAEPASPALESILGPFVPP